MLVCPFLSAAVSVTVARLAYNGLEVRIGESAALTLAAITLAAVIYFAMSFILGVVGKKEIALIPFLRMMVR